MPRQPPDWPVAKRFAEAITGRPNPKLTFQTFDDRGERKDIAGWKFGTIHDCARWLIRKSQNGGGIYFTVNQCDGTGRSYSTVVEATAVPLDLDGTPLPTEWPIPPDIIVESSESRFHCYWLVEATKDLNAWANCVARFAKFYGGDPKIFDWPRVLRLPGFDHLKRDPFRVRVLKCPDPTDVRLDGFGRRTLQELADAHPCEFTPPRDRDPAAEIKSAVSELDTDAALAVGRGYLETAPVAIEGERGNNRAYSVFCKLNDFGISPEMSVELATTGDDPWNDRCLPPFSIPELERLARNAAKYKHDPAGIESAEAILAEFGEDDPEWGELPPESVKAKNTEKGLKKSRFAGMGLQELRGLPPLEYLVEGLIPIRQLFELYGARKSGKTFLSIDLGLCVATGLDWHGRKVKQGRSLHIVGEGNLGGVRNRVEAWILYQAQKTGINKEELERRVFENWRLVGVPVHVDKSEVLEAFIVANPGKFDLVIIDTLLRNMSGDVLDASDAQKFIAACDRIRQKMEAAVVVVHHEGKDATRGSLGSTVIEAAVDGAARFSRPDVTKSKRILEITLLRDASDNIDPLVFDFLTVDLPSAIGGDGDMKDQSSAVLILKGKEEDQPDTYDETLMLIADNPDATYEQLGKLAGGISKQAISGHITKLYERNHLDKETRKITEAGEARIANLLAKQLG